MNIKYWYLLGMLSISTGICGDNPKNNDGFDGLFDGLFSTTSNNYIANSNQPESASQQNQVVNVNNVPGNNLRQQFVSLAQQSGLVAQISNSNNAGQLTFGLEMIGEILNQMSNPPNANLRLAIAVERLRSRCNNANNIQSPDRLSFLVGILLHIISSPNANLANDFAFVVNALLDVQKMFDDPNYMSLLVKELQSKNVEERTQLLLSIFGNTNNAQPNSLFNP